ncbi:MAG: hypothetical protein IJJ29_07110 [Solobacterium sp.]|nr:hypothetical protein [Solobacterium sp.]
MTAELKREITAVFTEILEEELRCFRDTLREALSASEDGRFKHEEEDGQLISHVRTRLAEVIADREKREMFVRETAVFGTAAQKLEVMENEFLACFDITPSEYEERAADMYEQSLQRVYAEYRRGYYDRETPDSFQEEERLQRFREGLLSSCRKHAGILLEGKEKLNASGRIYADTETVIKEVIDRYLNMVYRDSLRLITVCELREKYRIMCEAVMHQRDDGRLYAGHLYSLYYRAVTGEYDYTLMPRVMTMRQREIMGGVLRN